MKILLTGAAGFIGMHTAQLLIEKGHTVVGVDNFNDYYDVQLKRDREQELSKLGIEINEFDVSDYIKLSELCSENEFDAVCHLAAQAGVRYSIENPFSYEKANGLGTLSVLEACRHNNIKTCVYASSSSVYGGIREYPFHEEMKLDTPISLYAATKKYNELQAHVYHHLYGINVTGLRFFTVYGPWGRPDMAPILFADAMRKGETIDVYNNGEMWRDFTYVKDIAAGVVASIEKGHECEVFNLARGECVKLMEFIDEIEDALGVEADKNMMEMQPGDVPRTDASIDKAKEMLGYDPKTSVKEGVKDFVDWHKRYYS